MNDPLDMLFNQLEIELTKQTGYQIHSRHLKIKGKIDKRQWGIYKDKNLSQNICYISKQKRSDVIIPNCTLPHIANRCRCRESN